MQKQLKLNDKSKRHFGVLMTQPEQNYLHDMQINY